MDEMMDIVDETESDGVLALAALLRPPAPPSQRRRRVPVTIPIRRSDADAAGGVEIVHRTTAAVASPDDPRLRAKAANVIAALASLKPRTPMESSLAGLFVAMSAAALELACGGEDRWLRHPDRRDLAQPRGEAHGQGDRTGPSHRAPRRPGQENC